MSKKKLVVKIFAISTGKHLCWSLFLLAFRPAIYKKETSTQVFSREYHEIFKKTYFENICEWLCLCISPVLSNIIFQIHTESLLHVQPSLLRNIFCVISVDNKIQRGLQLQNTVQFTCTENIENRVKQFENLKKKLRGVNTCCF